MACKFLPICRKQIDYEEAKERRLAIWYVLYTSFAVSTEALLHSCHDWMHGQRAFLLIVKQIGGSIREEARRQN